MSDNQQGGTQRGSSEKGCDGERRKNRAACKHVQDLGVVTEGVWWGEHVPVAMLFLSRDGFIRMKSIPKILPLYIFSTISPSEVMWLAVTVRK